jgi:hypothetical protein
VVLDDHSDVEVVVVDQDKVVTDATGAAAMAAEVIVVSASRSLIKRPSAYDALLVSSQAVADSHSQLRSLPETERVVLVLDLVRQQTLQRRSTRQCAMQRST